MYDKCLQPANYKLIIVNIIILLNPHMNPRDRHYSHCMTKKTDAKMEVR